MSFATNYYATYSHAPQGSTRALGLGGAYTGLSDDAAGMIYNPAGIALSQFRFDFGKTDNYTLNNEVDINNDGSVDGVPFQYQFTSAAAHWGSWAFALAMSSPYLANMVGSYGSFQKAQVHVQSQDLILAYAFANHFSVGAMFRNMSLKETYSVYGQPTYEATGRGTSTVFGISYRPENKLGFGVSYTPPLKIDVDTTLNQNLGYNSTTYEYGWFQGVVFPQKFTFGGFYGGTENVVYIADLDFITAPKGSVYMRNPFVSTMYQYSDVKTYTFQIPHGGIEVTLLKDDRKKFIWRVGGYREPARITGADDRLHVTMGVEVRMGPLVASASMDETNGFSNSSQSIQFTLGDNK